MMNKTHHHILLSIKTSKRVINSTYSKYQIVREVAQEMGYRESNISYTLYWTDHPLTIREIRQQPPYTRINHLPEIGTLTRKNKLAQALNCMKRHFPKQYDFYPETFILPNDQFLLSKRLSISTQHKKLSQSQFYIVKPENGSQGKGIFLVKGLEGIERKLTGVVVQKYISKPKLINGLKFDMRVFVFITNLQPLRVYLFRDGLARFATEKFQQPSEDNLDNFYQHLTNYAINKNHPQFMAQNKNLPSTTPIHKRLLSSLFSPSFLDQLHQKLSPLIIKTIISGLPVLENAYSQCRKHKNNQSCFQLLGFDVLVDESDKLWLLEVNQNPSLMTETAVDRELKRMLVKNILQMIQIPIIPVDEHINSSRQRLKDKYELSHIDNFIRIYPSSNEEQTFQEFIQKSEEIYRDKFGMNIVRTKQNSKKEVSVHLNIAQKEQEGCIAWNQSHEFYSKDKMQKVYKANILRGKTSQKRRLVFY